ncbi:imidazole glycerol phosphate synthase subunit HisH [Psychrosphaera saromensis]|uniref:Imidazole glycerol phosphate synthase subunit HisH n=1 Tax=Psychrosphaera saromensis TaxID=716813 RepID=A0A2S7UW64_9GAMM|nr:imidazole glycerol phosphate synthase subunit HisH [Psychrosphaera saromensis]PQJ53988.1 imidazole glycerol phosphate synthase subunit HisH [Psychrosphaera saromensis]GHB75937.1 imidazole glycerol phosphate synthase subunit HisH [Psychrosphaera saromensis]GLQ14525.1 imidazole glycerol phosphate synthase subunit HisH [Psychrosphaera saromensis]
MALDKSSLDKSSLDSKESEQKIVIIDTGCANISSVKFAVERLGVTVTVSDDPSVILSADKVFLPGVGSASSAMSNIKQKALVETIQQITKPVLGICLGMQLMTEFSNEVPGSHIASNITESVDCLNLIPTEVSRMDTADLVSPHMGWNQIKVEKDNPLFAGIADGSYFYFVHSFCAPVSQYTLASCEYGQAFSAAIGNNNFYGVQFHPERSGDAGATLLQNFIRM